MFRKIDAFWRPPQFDNIELTWRARPTYLMARSLLLITLVTTLAAGLLPPNKPAGPVIGLTIAFILLLSMVLVRRGHVGLVNWAMPGLVLLAVMTALWLGYLSCGSRPRRDCDHRGHRLIYDQPARGSSLGPPLQW
ncbi:MAG: hypothetical protein IPK16_18995 [Anaerolineales bacterium]|nr:hypothetical protein [Anaerolineales bacterium]